MRKACRKIFPVILTLFMIFPILSTMAFAESTHEMSFSAVEETVTATDVPDYSGKPITSGVSFALYKSDDMGTALADYNLQGGVSYTLKTNITNTDIYDTVEDIVFKVAADGTVTYISGNDDGSTASVSEGIMSVTVPRKSYKLEMYVTNKYSGNTESCSVNGDEQNLNYWKNKTKSGDKIEMVLNPAGGCKLTGVELKMYSDGIWKNFEELNYPYTCTTNSDGTWTVSFIRPSGNIQMSTTGAADYVPIKANIIGGTVTWTAKNDSENNPSKILYENEVTMTITPYTGRTLHEDGVSVTYIAGAGFVKTVALTDNGNGTWKFNMPELDATINALYECNEPVKFRINDKNGQAVNDATVKQGTGTLTSDSNGVYTVVFKQAGECTCTVSAIGYEDKVFKIIAVENGNDGLGVTVNGASYSKGSTAVIDLQRATMNAQLKIVDSDNKNTDLTGNTVYSITDGNNNAVQVMHDASGYFVNGLNWGENYKLTVTKAADGYKLPTSETTFSFDRTGKLTVNGDQTEDNTVEVKLEKTAVKIETVSANDGQLTGVTVQIFDDAVKFDEFVSANSAHKTEKAVTGKTYTIKVTDVPTGKAIPNEVTFILNADGTIADGTTAVYNGDTVTLKIWNSIEVDANGNGTIDSGELNAVVGEPENGIYKDAVGVDKQTYLPVDVNGDGASDHYVPSGILTDGDNDGIWTNTAGDALYLPSGYDSDGNPTGFFKIVDSNNDGIYGKDNGTGTEKDNSDKYISDKDGDGKVETDRDGDSIFEGSKDENGDGKPDNRYIPIIDENGSNAGFIVDSNGDDIFTAPGADGKEQSDPSGEYIKYIPDIDGDGKPEPDNDGNGIFEGTQGSNSYIPDDLNQDGETEFYVDDNKDGIYGTADNSGNEEGGANRKYFIPIDSSEPKDGIIDGVKEVTKKNEYVYVDSDGTASENGTEYIADADGDGLPEPDNDNNGIFEGTANGTKYKENGSKYKSNNTNIHVISINKSDNGTVKSSSVTAATGKSITLTVKANDDFVLQSLTVIGVNGSKIKLTDNGDGTWSFTMPNSSVTVTAKFTGKNTDIDPSDIDSNNAIILTINERMAYVFGRIVISDVAPVIRNGRTMLPIRFITENLGGKV